MSATSFTASSSVSLSTSLAYLYFQGQNWTNGRESKTHLLAFYDRQEYGELEGWYDRDDGVKLFGVPLLLPPDPGH